jgi:hypothetical protein
MTVPDDPTGVNVYEVDDSLPPHASSLTYDIPLTGSDSEDNDKSGTQTPRTLTDKDNDKGYSKEVETGYTTESSSDYDQATEHTPMEAFKRKVDGDESPFPEVQACVPTDDDPTIMINREFLLLRSKFTLLIGNLLLQTSECGSC